MKKIDGEEAIIEILKIGKEIYSQNEKIMNSGIFGKNVDIDVLPAINIYDIIAKLTDNTLNEKDAMEINEIYKKQDIENECLAEEGDTPYWVMNVVFDYYENKTNLEELINILFEN